MLIIFILNVLNILNAVKSEPCSTQSLYSLDHISEIRSSIVIFDIDETVFMPNTSFVYGLEKTDTFVSFLQTSYPETFSKKVMSEMESIYYKTPVFLLEGELTKKIIEKLKMNGNLVVAMTARKMKPEDHWEDVLPYLRSFNISFESDFGVDLDVPFTNFLEGVFFSGERNKGNLSYQFYSFIKEQVCQKISKLEKVNEICKNIDNAPMMLIDNTLENCQKFCEFVGPVKANSKSYHYRVWEKLFSFKDMLYQFSNISNNLDYNKTVLVTEAVV